MPVPEPKIYSCAEWGARAPLHAFAQTDGDVSCVQHHTAGQNRSVPVNPQDELHEAFELARSIQAAHMDANGWADTGQTFTVSRGGVILEGRHGSLAAAREGHAVQAAHCIPKNYCHGVEAEGIYTSELPPPAQWAALVHLHAWLADRQKLDSASIGGHRDFDPETACPGDALHAALPRLRQDVHDFIMAHRS